MRSDATSRAPDPTHARPSRFNGSVPYGWDALATYDAAWTHATKSWERLELLDVGDATSQRTDGHCGTCTHTTSPQMHDCLHYCLPGVPDVWNGRLHTLLRAKLAAAPGGEAPPLLARWNFGHIGVPFVAGAAPTLAFNVHPPHVPAVALECAPHVATTRARPLLGFCSDLQTRPVPPTPAAGDAKCASSAPNAKRPDESLRMQGRPLERA